MLGNMINVAAIAVGWLIGWLFGSRLNESIKNGLLNAACLGVILLGLSKALNYNNFIIVLISLTLGCFIGELLDINGAMERLGNAIERKFKSGDGASDASGGANSFSRGFVYATLIFCIGPMAIMGSIESGLAGDYSTLITKAVLDGIGAIILTATMGIGVIGAAFSTGLYQGTIILASGLIADHLTEAMITEMTATGGVLIMAIGLNAMEIRAIKTANLLPAIFIACGLVHVWQFLPFPQ